MQGDSEHIIVLLLLALTLSLALYEIKKKIGIPIAPLLLLGGVMTGIVSETDNLNQWFQILKSIDYELVELVFLPGLIFETALTLDWYMFKRYVPLIVLMATAGVVATWVLSSLAVGSLYEWDWKQCFILGTVLSTTDHVAVVMELRELHAERRFSILLQGETLLNEALVFVLLQDVLREHSASESVKLFFRLTLGGVALGLVASAVMHQLLKQIVNDAVQETYVLMIASYVLFFVNEKAEFSGAVSVAVLGLYMSAYGKTSISASVEHEVHLIWQFFTQSIESIVFFLSGVIAGLIIRDREIHLSDVWKLICLLLYSLAIRAAVVLILFPVMNRMKTTYRWKEAVVMACSGVKGVISIVFGLIVYHAEQLSKEMVAEVMFQTVCISTCSIFLSHFLIRLVVHLLGLSSYSKPEALCITHSVYQIFEENEAFVQGLKAQENYSDVNWSGISEIITPNIVLPELVAPQRSISVARPRINTEQELLNLVQAAGPLPSESDFSLIRRKFILIYRRLYWHEYEHGQCFPMSIVQLDNAASRSLELVAQPIREWEYIRDGLIRGVVPRLIQHLADTRFFRCLFLGTARNQLQTAFDVASTFLAVQRRVASHFLQETAWDKQQIAAIIAESEQQQTLCEEFLTENFTNMHRELKEKVQSKKACYAFLKLIRQKTEEAFQGGRIGEEYYSRMIGAVDRKLKALDLIVSDLVSKPKREEMSLSSRDLY